MYFVFDTETTGLPKCTSKNDKYWNNWNDCRLVSIGWIIFDKNYKIHSSKYYLISSTNRPSEDNIPIELHNEYDTFITKYINYDIRVDFYNSSPESLAIHNIDDDYRNSHGVSFLDVIFMIISDLRHCKGVISHSNYFDIGVILNECKLRRIPINYIKTKTIYDTKLSDRYIRADCLEGSVKKLFNASDELFIIISNSDRKAHDSLYDAYLCLALFKYTDNKNKMKRNNIKHLIKQVMG